MRTVWHSTGPEAEDGHWESEDCTPETCAVEKMLLVREQERMDRERW